MKQKWSQLIVLLLLAVLAGIGLKLWLCPAPPPEPEYGGQPLVKWIVLYAGAAAVHPPTPGAVVASNAVCAFGTNAVPCLLDWIQHPRPARPFYRIMTAICGVLPAGWGPGIGSPWITDVEPLRRDAAPIGLALLGTNALSAVPELKRIQRQYAGQPQGNLARFALWRMQINLGTNFPAQ